MSNKNKGKDTDKDGKSRPGKPFTFEVDSETFETSEQRLTAGDILQLAGRDPEGFDLQRIRGGKKEVLEDDAVVKINSGLAFLAIPSGPSTVA